MASNKVNTHAHMSYLQHVGRVTVTELDTMSATTVSTASLLPHLAHVSPKSAAWVQEVITDGSTGSGPTPRSAAVAAATAVRGGSAHDSSAFHTPSSAGAAQAAASLVDVALHPRPAAAATLPGDNLRCGYVLHLTLSIAHSRRVCVLRATAAVLDCIDRVSKGLQVLQVTDSPHAVTHTLTHTCPDPTLHQLLPNMPCYVRFAARAGAAAAGSLAFVPVRCELALPLHDVPLHADVCASMCASTSTGASAWSKATLEAHKSCLAELEAQLWEFMMPHVLPAQASAGAVSSLQQQVCLGAAPTPLHPVLFPGTGSAVVSSHADAK